MSNSGRSELDEDYLLVMAVLEGSRREGDDYIRAKLALGRLHTHAMEGKGASQGAEGVGLTVHEADIIAAAVQLVPLLEEGWDEYDAPEDQSEGARACDALIKAVNAMLQAPDEQKG